jgi:hypothetical protein
LFGLLIQIPFFAPHSPKGDVFIATVSSLPLQGAGGQHLGSGNLCQFIKHKEIPVFDISVYINDKEFRYVYEIHYYCNYFVKLGLFVEYSIL